MKNKRKACKNSIHWIRGHLSHLEAEFNLLSDYVKKAVGVDGMVDSFTAIPVMAPVVLSLCLVILISCNGVVTFNLLLLSEFSGRVISENMLIVVAALKIVGSLGGLLISSWFGLKMLLLIG